MTKVYRDLSGQRFGRLTAIEYVGDGKWKCKCDCGNISYPSSSVLLRGTTKSCGCYRDESMGNRFRTHGQTKTRLFSIWQEIKKRCYNPNYKDYKYYGGKGITICDEWLNDFMAFYDWSIANGYDPSKPAKECTIDRIDNSKGYSPTNCRWTNSRVQAFNQHKPTGRSGVTGVFVTKHGKYMAYITRNYKRTNLGTFDNLEDAKRVRHNAETDYWKELSV